ncbi:MAG: hypothetical protein ACE14S_02090 [Candidatus Bathyarchaeia archaeon]
MDRKATVELLKEIMMQCETFTKAQAVSIQEDKQHEGFALSITWLPEPEEQECLRSLAAKYGARMEIEGNRTVFHAV